MYLMDAMVRTLGTAEHPIRTRLIEATDQAFVEQAFEAFLETLREAATPSVVAHIEQRRGGTDCQFTQTRLRRIHSCRQRDFSAGSGLLDL
ncbi:hypothetical protein [Cupriavidus necator]